LNITLSDTLIPSRATHVVLHWQDDDLIVQGQSDTLSSRLNITAAFIWQHCDGKTQLNEIIKAINEDSGCEYSDTRKNVSEAVKALFNKKLIQLNQAEVQSVLRVRFLGFRPSFDHYENYFLTLLLQWVDILVVGDNEQADIVIATNKDAAPVGAHLIAPVRMLVDESRCEDYSEYDLVFTPYDQITDTPTPSIPIPRDYLTNKTGTLYSAGRQLLQELLSRENAFLAMTMDQGEEKQKKLTIGMATYDDYDGVYFSVQAIRMFHPDVLNEIEILVIDNHPDGPCNKDLKALGAWIKEYRYISNDTVKGTAVRDLVFRQAQTPYVMCIDSHVFIEPGAIRKLIDYFDTHPDTPDLLQGPMVYDNLKDVATHFEPLWQQGMMGIWSTDERGCDIDAEPFDIPMQGMGLAACRKEAWPGYSSRFKGFCVEEGYVHQKFRNAGARTLCLPFLRWLHRFARPMGVPYENIWEDRIRNYLIAFEEVGLDRTEVIDHFSEYVNPDVVQNVIKQLEDEDKRGRSVNNIELSEELPFVSCFCSTYGRPHLLEEAIESFLRQDYRGRKELVILNDFDKQELVYDHPEIRIINSPERIMPLGRKFNECIRLCQGDILFVWEDDDIYLPWRIRQSVKRMNNGLFHTSQGYFEDQKGGPLTTSRNMFHCNLAVSKKRFWKVGGYPEDRDMGDVDVDIFRRLKIDSTEISQKDVFYIYRWSGTGSYHASQYDGREECVSEFAEKQISNQICTGECPTGRIELQPHWTYDWIHLVENLRETV